MTAILSRIPFLRCLCTWLFYKIIYQNCYQIMYVLVSFAVEVHIIYKTYGTKVIFLLSTRLAWMYQNHFVCFLFANLLLLTVFTNMRADWPDFTMTAAAFCQHQKVIMEVSLRSAYSTTLDSKASFIFTLLPSSIQCMQAYTVGVCYL